MNSADRKLPQCSLPREIVKSVHPGTDAFTGTAMAMIIAGEPVVVIARSIAKLDIVFNYVEAKMNGGNAELMDTLRTSACPEVAIVRKDRMRFDDEL